MIQNNHLLLQRYEKIANKKKTKICAGKGSYVQPPVGSTKKGNTILQKMKVKTPSKVLFKLFKTNGGQTTHSTSPLPPQIKPHLQVGWQEGDNGLTSEWQSEPYLVTGLKQ